MKKHKYKPYILWLVIILSILSMLFSPLGPLIQRLKSNLPWVSLGILLSEITLTVGFLLMLYVATPAFVRKLTRNLKSTILGIFDVKREVDEFNWSHVAKRCNDSKTFWLGYWISVVGALGDGIVIIIAIGNTLPIGSWGLMILPFWDLGLTFIIRKAIFQGVKRTEETFETV